MEDGCASYYLFSQGESVGGRGDKTTKFTIAIDRFTTPRPEETNDIILSVGQIERSTMGRDQYHDLPARIE
jgi:hypothetical protein